MYDYGVVLDKKKTIKTAKKRDISNLDTPDEKENSITMEDSNGHATVQSKDEVFDTGKIL